MSSVDLRARMPLRVVEDIDADGAQPGDVMVLRRDRDDAAPIAGYAMRCPGCGRESYLPVYPETEHDKGRPRWRIEAGDPRTGEGLTLSPSVWHLHGCGWHGWVRAGWWEPG